MINKENFRDNMKYYDKSIVLQVIDIFLTEYTDRLTELQNSVTNLDFDAIDHHAHSFKGVVTYMSPELAERARTLEYKGKEKDASALEEIMKLLRDGTFELAIELEDVRVEYV